MPSVSLDLENCNDGNTFELLHNFSNVCTVDIVTSGSKSFLNKPSRKLSYFSKAVYPVYIVHMPIQYAFSYFIIPTALPAPIKLVFILAATFGGSLALYEYVIKRVKWIRPFFGLKFLTT